MSMEKFLSIPELMLIFDYPSQESIREALRKGELKDLPTFKFHGKIFAAPEVVNAFIQKFVDEGLFKLSEGA